MLENDLLWWIVATLCAYFVKGLCGFANTLVFSTILSFGNNNINITPVELLLGYPTNAILAWKERKSINWGMSLPLAMLVLIGSIPGVLFLKNAHSEVVKVVLGVVIVVIGIEMLLRERQTGAGKQSKILLLTIGLISGILCGVYGIGALLSAYISRTTRDSHAFKGNICLVFFFENTFRVLLYIYCGIITLETAKQSLMLVPVMLVGLFAGMASGKILNERVVKKIVIVMLIVSGVALIVNNL